jgi:hypothetical protein
MSTAKSPPLASEIWFVPSFQRLKRHTLQGATPNASMIRGLLRLAPRIEPCSETSLL